MTYSGGMRGSPPQALRAWGGWECLSAYGLQGIPILPISVGQEPSRPKGRRKKGRQGTSNEAVRVSAKSQSLLRDFSTSVAFDINRTALINLSFFTASGHHASGSIRAAGNVLATNINDLIARSNILIRRLKTDTSTSRVVSLDIDLNISRLRNLNPIRLVNSQG